MIRSGDTTGTDGELDAGTQALLDHVLRCPSSSSGNPLSDEDLVNHVLGIKPLPPGSQSASSARRGSSQAHLRSNPNPEWNQRQEEELERLKDVNLSANGVANEPALSDRLAAWTQSEEAPLRNSPAHLPKRAPFGLRR